MVSLNEISLKQWQDENLEHLRYEYEGILPGEQVLDIGSYRMEWGNEMIKRYGVKIESFDALDNKAAWTYNGRIRTGGAYYYTSMFDENIVNEYWCVDIAPYLEKEIAVCKINIEGGEYDLIKYILDRGLIKNIRNLQVQFHLIKGRNCEAMFNVLDREIKHTHDQIFDYHFCWTYWKRKC